MSGARLVTTALHQLEEPAALRPVHHVHRRPGHRLVIERL
jgi:hypothetical protein